jgi:hypothetical protein
LWNSTPGSPSGGITAHFVEPFGGEPGDWLVRGQGQKETDLVAGIVPLDVETLEILPPAGQVHYLNAGVDADVPPGLVGFDEGKDQQG